MFVGAIIVLRIQNASARIISSLSVSVNEYLPDIMSTSSRSSEERSAFAAALGVGKNSSGYSAGIPALSLLGGPTWHGS